MLRIRGNKYGAKRCRSNGITFDSLIEHERYQQLCTLWRANVISKLEVHTPFTLRVGAEKFIIKPDFVYLEGHKQVIEDVKGYMRGTAWSLFKIKWALLREQYPEYELRIFTKDGYGDARSRRGKRKAGRIRG